MSQTKQEITDEVIDEAIEKATKKPIPENVDASTQSIVFYCKNCKEIVPAEKKGKSLTFVCPKCTRNNIAIGTQNSIENYYRLTK